MNPNTLIVCFIPLMSVLTCSCGHVNHLARLGEPSLVTVETSVEATLGLEFTKRGGVARRSVMGPIGRASAAEYKFFSALKVVDILDWVPFVNQATASALDKRLGWAQGGGGDVFSIRVTELRLVAEGPMSSFSVVGELDAELQRNAELVWGVRMEFALPAGRESVQSLSQLPPELRQGFWRRLAEQVAALLVQHLIRDGARGQGTVAGEQKGLIEVDSWAQL